jgi:hypothetical protein
MPRSSEWFLIFRLSTKISCAFLIPFVRPTRPAYVILSDLITLITFGKEYKVWSSSLCDSLHSPVTSSLLGPNIPLRTVLTEHTQSVLRIASICCSADGHSSNGNKFKLRK